MILLFSAAPVALPVSAARSDSRRLAQQASRCSKGCRFCLREEIRGGGWCSRLPVVQKASGFGCTKRFTAAAGAAGFPLLKKAAASACTKRFTAAAGAAGFALFKRLPVLPARRDSRRRLVQQASRCSKGCRFRLREAIRGGGWRSRLPVVKKGCRFCLREEIRGG
ncbi:hypothetical protein HMPREF1032_02615 [Subdoligranulum sp. 4_3_54A2FAA]|nr:hypothetical protein HMPREF1032_02615 [Subdoligranulum sp. 4_3_54A2FAA]